MIRDLSSVEKFKAGRLLTQWNAKVCKAAGEYAISFLPSHLGNVGTENFKNICLEAFGSHVSLFDVISVVLSEYWTKGLKALFIDNFGNEHKNELDMILNTPDAAESIYRLARFAISNHGMSTVSIIKNRRNADRYAKVVKAVVYLCNGPKGLRETLALQRRFLQMSQCTCATSKQYFLISPLHSLTRHPRRHPQRRRRPR
jgi:hypothetical protein